MPARSTEIALMMLRFVQPAPDGSVAARWTLWPAGRRLFSPQLCAALEAMPRPVLLSAHAEPGGVTAAPLAAADPEARPWLEHGWRNQTAALRASLDGLAPDAATGAGAEAVLIEPGDGAELVVGFPDLEAWAREYVVTSCGWKLAESGGDARARLRLLLRRPDGHWSPGLVCRPPRPAA